MPNRIQQQKKSFLSIKPHNILDNCENIFDALEDAYLL